MGSLKIDGRFFSHQGERVTLRGVTLGPFPPRHNIIDELETITTLGANMVRLYEAPNKDFLDQAQSLGIHVFASIPWHWDSDFLSDPDTLRNAYRGTLNYLSEQYNHPALAGIYIANEIPVDLVRWMGIPRVKNALEHLINQLRSEFPDILYAYANFPTTEFLELSNTDFTAFNLYLEKEKDLQNYLHHLQLIAGSRPLVISEFGVDAGKLSSHGENGQEQLLHMATKVADEAGVMGMTYFSWSDVWWKGGQLVEGWKFGLQRSDGSLRPVAQTLFLDKPVSAEADLPLFSIIVCSYNGENRIGTCLESLLNLNDLNYEVIVVNDGSTDQCAEVAEQYRKDFENKNIPYQVIYQENHGLSHARNTGAKQAQGSLLAYTDDDARPDQDWLTWLRKGFSDPAVGMCGGYGIPPAQIVREAHEVAQLPGQACPVLLNDTEAEHLPGCNMAVQKAVWKEVDGFNTRYRVAGDDVDFCWRVIEAGYQVRFTPNAYVWHDPRPTYWAYLKQQWGYGKAEASLALDHPERVKANGISWKGAVYEGDAITYQNGSVVYAGIAGLSPFQPLQTRPETRDLPETVIGKLIARYYPLIRMAARWKHGRRPTLKALLNLFQLLPKTPLSPISTHKVRYWRAESTDRESVLRLFETKEWKLISSPRWDAQRGKSIMCLALEYPDENGQTLLLKTNALAETEDVLDEAGWTKL